MLRRCLFSDMLIEDNYDSLSEFNMSTEQNKAVVRRFIKEILSDGNIAVADELLAPNYVNKGMGGINRAAFKEALVGLKAALPQRSFDIENIIAEGDSVVFRGTMKVTRADGRKDSARVITYYRVTDGKISEDDPISIPDLRQFIGL